MDLIHEPLRCRVCLSQMGLRVRGRRAVYVCPNECSAEVFDLCQLNGAYDLSKVGGTDG